MQGPPELPEELLEDLAAYAEATGSTMEEVLEESLRLIADSRVAPVDRLQARPPADTAPATGSIRAAR